MFTDVGRVKLELNDYEISTDEYVSNDSDTDSSTVSSDTIVSSTDGGEACESLVIENPRSLQQSSEGNVNTLNSDSEQ